MQGRRQVSQFLYPLSRQLLGHQENACDHALQGNPLWLLLRQVIQAHHLDLQPDINSPLFLHPMDQEQSEILKSKENYAGL